MFTDADLIEIQHLLMDQSLLLHGNSAQSTLIVGAVLALNSSDGYDLHIAGTCPDWILGQDSHWSSGDSATLYKDRLENGLPVSLRPSGDLIELTLIAPKGNRDSNPILSSIRQMLHN